MQRQNNRYNRNNSRSGPRQGNRRSFSRNNNNRNQRSGFRDSRARSPRPELKPYVDPYSVFDNPSLVKGEDIKVPGSLIGYEEEYTSGLNTFDHNGSVLSQILGNAFFDNENRVAMVKANKQKRFLSEGCHVIAQVVNTTESMAMVEILYAEINETPVTITDRQAAIPLRMVSESYVKDMESVFRIGDIVKGKIIKFEPPMVDITTKGQDLGVIKAYCTKCRSQMNLSNNNVKCSCGSVEERKLSSEYM